MGSSLWEAYLRLEKVEHTAQITLAAQQLGQVGTLSPEAVAELATLRHDLLQRQGRDVCDGCTVCLLGDDKTAVAGDKKAVADGEQAGSYQTPLGGLPGHSTAPDEESLVRQITEAVVSNLKGGRARQ